VQLHRLKLENFRLHADTDIQFGPGVTAIVGPNGAGKSTLLEAVAWAIYGTPAARGSRDSIRRSNAAPRAPVRVELDFSFGAHQYKVVRSLYNAELYQDSGSAPVVTSQQGVTEKVGQLLGMTRSEFFNTYFTGQKELAVMAAMGPTDRAKFLSRLMGYERLRFAQDRLRTERSSIRGGITELEQGVGSKEVVEEELRDAEARLAKAMKRQSEIAKTLHVAREQMSDVGPKWKAISELRDSILSLQGERSIAQQQVREARREHERLDQELTKAVAARNELAGLRGDVEGADAIQEEFERLDTEAEAAGRKRTVSGQIDEVNSQIETVEERLAAVGGDDDLIAAATAALERHHAALDQSRADEERHRTSWVRDKQDAETKTSSLRGQYEDLRSHKKGLLEAGSEGNCPTCARPLGDEFEAVLATVGRQMEEVESTGKFYRKRVEQLQSAPELLRRWNRASRTWPRPNRGCGNGNWLTRIIRGFVSAGGHWKPN
jgi:exonuclease SbcC